MTDRLEPPPSIKIVRAIEERSLRAWPAFETRPCRGWQVRYAEGYTKRANSANAVEPVARFGIVKPMVEIFYRAHRQPVIVRLTPLSGDDAEPLLVRSGYERIDPTLVMIAKLPPPAQEDGVSLQASLAPGWSAGFAAAAGLTPAQRDLHDRILMRIEPARTFASVSENGRMLGFGLAVADQGLVGLFDIVVDPAARRQGIGRRLVLALMEWGRRQGAGGAYLQVGEANEAALAFYTSLGFQDAYHYHYRIAA